MKRLKGAGICCLALLLSAPGPAIPGAFAASGERSDLNRDGIIDLVDLDIFANKFIEQNIEDVDWCAFYEVTASAGRIFGKQTSYYRKHFGLLLSFINDEFRCDGGPLLLGIENEPRGLVRIALDENTGNYFISDSQVGSVFIYDSSRTLVGELKNLEKPIAVGIDSKGLLLVGNDGSDNIEVYDPSNGDLLLQFGQGLVQMPTAITIGPSAEIYVIDSGAHRVWVFEPGYLHVRTIGFPGPGEGQLKFPTDAAVLVRDDGGTTVEELYVSDQFNRRIQVFDLAGNYLRAIEPLMTMSSFCGRFAPNCPDAHGTFVRLQAIAFDSLGRLHSLDVMESSVTILDPVSGSMIDSYGGLGEGPGLVKTPLDVLLTPWGNAVITDGANDEIEVYEIH